MLEKIIIAAMAATFSTFLNSTLRKALFEDVSQLVAKFKEKSNDTSSDSRQNDDEKNRMIKLVLKHYSIALAVVMFFLIVVVLTNLGGIPQVNVTTSTSLSDVLVCFSLGCIINTCLTLIWMRDKL